MELPVLVPPARGGGCIDRGLETVDLEGGLGQVQVIVSGCQQHRFETGLAAKLAELRGLNLDREELQRRLQSWIDGGSPCDQPYAERDDRLSWEEAMAAETAHHGSGSSPPGMPPGVAMIVFRVQRGLPPPMSYHDDRRRPGIPRWMLIYCIAALFLIGWLIVRIVSLVMK